MSITRRVWGQLHESKVHGNRFALKPVKSRVHVALMIQEPGFMPAGPWVRRPNPFAHECVSVRHQLQLEEHDPSLS